jgi:predicted ribosome quality control (RQC) complex YloA/Tae2 family protein
MIQFYLDMQKQVANAKAEELSYGQIQKIYSTAFFVSFSIRTRGKTLHLFLGRGAGHEGLWLHKSAPPSELRRRDNFLEYLRRHLSACSLVNLELDDQDRILKVDYQKYGQIQSILFFWKARKLYFLHYFQDVPEGPFKLLLSWRAKAVTATEDIGNLFKYFDEVGRRNDMVFDRGSAQSSTIEELLEDELKAASLIGMTSNPTFLQRKKENIEDDLRKAKQWERLQHLLDQGENLDMYELKVEDQKIKFEGELNPYERRNLVFQKIKKLKRGEGILSQRLESVKELLSGKKTETNKTSQLPIVKPVWGKEELAESKSHQENTETGYRVFKFDHFQIGVGLTAQGNDQLRSKWAGKEDLWLHMDGLKSAHVIIKSDNQAAINPENLNLAASILAHFSHFNDAWIPIIHTQVKNLKGVTGAPGMVIYKKEKHLRCPKLDNALWLKD